MSQDSSDPIDAILASGRDADDVLRAVVEALASRHAIAWAGIRFLDDGVLTLGPSAGAPDDKRRTQVSILYRGDAIGELVVDGEADVELLGSVAERLSEYVLLGWDTDGVAWEP